MLERVFVRTLRRAVAKQQYTQIIDFEIDCSKPYKVHDLGEIENFSISLKFSEFCAGLPLHKAVFRKFAVEFRKENFEYCSMPNYMFSNSRETGFSLVDTVRDTGDQNIYQW